MPVFLQKIVAIGIGPLLFQFLDSCQKPSPSFHESDPMPFVSSDLIQMDAFTKTFPLFYLFLLRYPYLRRQVGAAFTAYRADYSYCRWRRPSYRLAA